MRNNLPLKIFLLITLLSLMAPLIINDRPLVMSHRGQLYFPIFKDYQPKDFSLSGYIMDYIVSEEELKQQGWMVFPPLKQRPNAVNLTIPTDNFPARPTSCVQMSDSKNQTCHLLGTDTSGRDLLARILYGTRNILLTTLAITLLASLLGVLIGGLSGYAGGLLDLTISRLLEVLGHFPILLLIITLVALLDKPSTLYLVLIFAIVGISPFAFYTRGQVLRIRKLTFVEAAQAIGLSPLQILLRHILPNALTPIFILLPFYFAGTMGFLSTIEFLGFAQQAPEPSLGELIRSGFDDISGRWWLIVFPSCFLIILTTLAIFAGEKLKREEFNTKLRYWS